MVERSPCNLYFDNQRGVYLVVGKRVLNRDMYGLGKFVDDGEELVAVSNKTLRKIVRKDLEKRLHLDLTDEGGGYDYPEMEINVLVDAGGRYFFVGPRVNEREYELSQLVGKNECMIEASSEFLENVAQIIINRNLKRGFSKLYKIAKEYDKRKRGIKKG